MASRDPNLGVRALAFRPGGKQLAVAVDKAVHLWDVEARERRLTFDLHDEGVTEVLFSPDGTRVVSAEEPIGAPGGKHLRVWDPDTGRPTLPAALDIAMFSRLVFEPRSGHLVVVPSLMGQSQVVDIRAGALVARRGGILTFHPDGRPAIKPDVLALAFSPEGSRGARAFAKSPTQSRLEVVDLGNGGVVSSISFPERLAVILAFNKGGTRLAVQGTVNGAEEPGTLSLWDTATGREALLLAPEGGYIANPQFTPDGHRLVTSIGGGVLRIWDGTPLPDDRAAGP